MKKNKHNRRVSAYERLNEQVGTLRMSKEFNETLEGLSGDEMEVRVLKYWERKRAELTALKSKLNLV